MKIIQLLVAALIIFSCSAARASYYEYCYLDGQVLSASKAKRKSSKIEFLVSSSVASTLKNEGSYNPEVCSTYIGKTIKIKFRTEQKTQYTAGQSLKVLQIRVDAMTGSGMATLTGWEAVKQE